MEPIVMVGAPAPAHSLIRLREPTVLAADGPTPSWVEAALRRTPWVVVRRGCIQAGAIPVGVRGLTRAQRFAAWLAAADVDERLSPEELIDSRYAPKQTRTETAPALAALARVAPLLALRGYRWGPGGSVGFELATGAAVVTRSSDLDVILHQARRLEPDEALALQVGLADAAVPARIDILLETPRGGVSLADLAAAPTRVLVRTPDGARLAVDPWAADADAWTEAAS